MFSRLVGLYPNQKQLLQRYLGVQLDEKLSWKFHVKNLKKKLSKTCGLIFKLRHYVPQSTCRIIYYSMFHSIILNSLINWRRASNSLLREIELLQNKFIKACLFQPRKTYVNLLFLKFQALTSLTWSLPSSCISMKIICYHHHLTIIFIKLESIHYYSTKRLQVDFFIARLIVSLQEKDCIIFAKKVWESISDEKKNFSFSTFKRRYKSSVLTLYKDS